MAIPAYSGPFGKKQAVRLLWRAGFGPRPGEADALVKLGSAAAAVDFMLQPGKDKLKGKGPKDNGGLVFTHHLHSYVCDRVKELTPTSLHI